MNRGLMLKAVHELWPVTLVCGLMIFVFEMLLAYILPTFQQQFSQQIAQLEFVQNIIKAMLGTDINQQIGPDVFTSFPWVHPVILSVVWAHAILCVARMPVGEVDRGTIDVLLGLPVARWRIYISETAVWLAAMLVLLAFALVGNVLGSGFVEEAMRPDPVRRLIVLCNLSLLYMAVGAMGWLFGVVCDRRGWAMTFAFAAVVASFFLHYLAQFWQPAESVVFLSFLKYYTPYLILRTGEWPVFDLAILAVVAGSLWGVTGFIFNRRDLCSV